jgi:hypothetical protein
MSGTLRAFPFVLCVASVAAAKPVTLSVTVIDRTVTTAFVEPGGSSGVRPGDEVLLGGTKRRVMAVSASYAAVEIGDSPLKVGATGTLVIDDERQAEVVERIRPQTPLSGFERSWAAPVLPATNQHPKPVPLGPIDSRDRNRLAVRVSGAGIIPFGGESALVRVEERVVAHYEPIRDVPFRIDADAAMQQWMASDLARRAASSSRPPVAVRRLELGYGADASARLAAGRLLYASSFLGTLDGVRLVTPAFSGFSAQVFGGVAPEPLSGAPELAQRRFGGEVRYDAPDGDLRPRVVVGGHASHFDGSLDERRLDAAVDLFPDAGRLGARAEFAFFDQKNPWGAAPVELQAADLDAAFNVGPFDVRFAGGTRRPERSRWLATFLPSEWLCILPGGPIPAAPCLSNGAVHSGMADVGLHVEHFGFDLGGSVSRTQGTNAAQNAAFANARLTDLPRTVRFDTGVMLARGTLLRSAAATFSPAIELLDGRADLSVHYRPAVMRYVAEPSAFIEHDIGPSLWISPMPQMEIIASGDFITSRDLQVLFLQTVVVYRPRI